MFMNSVEEITIFHKISDMRCFSKCVKGEGKTLALVPTMGALHSGHLSLVDIASEVADVVVVSIFVNPTQFGENEDYDKYVRDIRGDVNKLKEKKKVAAVFNPSVEEMYPKDFQTYIEVTSLQKPLCGTARPGHFRGVATVVAKLFNIVDPHYAVFGEKDFQQLRIIEQMVKDLNMDVKIISGPISRESDGLALSSRNLYLNQEERQKAASVYKSLVEIRRSFLSGNTDPRELVDIGIKVLLSNSINDIDYLEIRDATSLRQVEKASSGDVVFVAVRIGSARLIDNIRL